MAQLRGQGSYGLGAGPVPAFGGPSEDRAESSPLDAIREQTSKIEDLLDTISEPVKPYVLLQSQKFSILLLTNCVANRVALHTAISPRLGVSSSSSLSSKTRCG